MKSLGKESDLCFAGFKKVFDQMQQDIIERHEPQLDLGVAFPAAVLRVGIIEQPVKRFVKQVVDVTLLAEVENSNVSSASCPEQKMLGDGPIVPVDELIELATEKVAGVNSHEVKEAGLALRIPQILDAANGVGTGHRSRMPCIMSWSSSIRAVSVARSDAEA